MSTRDDEHARQNAIAWYGTICEHVRSLTCDYERLEELRQERADLVSELESASDQEERGAGEQALEKWDAENLEQLHGLAGEAGEFKSQDEAREAIEQSALSLEVRSGWANVGEPLQAEDFRILLTTGGPALQIRGELDEHMSPRRAWLEFQDWGTPWTQYHGADQETLLTWCGAFYFGEG